MVEGLSKEVKSKYTLIKKNMASSYLRVLDIVERGLSRNRGKVLYDLADTQLRLLGCEGDREDKIEGKHCGDDGDNIFLCISDIRRNIEESLQIFTILGVTTQYERLVVDGARRIRNNINLRRNES